MISPSFPMSSSSTQNDGMMFITASHPKINDLLQQYISSDTQGEKSFSTSSGTNQELWMDEYLIDFGCKYRIIVKEGKHKNGIDVGNVIEIVVHASMIGWVQVKDHASLALKSTFGADAVSVVCCTGRAPDANEHQGENDDSKTQPNVYPGFDFSITVHSSSLPKGETLASQCESLGKLRSLVLGSQLINVLKNLSDQKESPVTGDGNQQTFTIPMQRQCKAMMPMVVTKNQLERVTVVIPVTCLDDIDRALAKLFLQQFQQAQRQTSKNVPICEFRRSSEPPREISSFVDAARGDDDAYDMDNLAGYMSFTFLDSYFHSANDKHAMAQQVTDNILMFTDFLDYHIKCSKSYIHTRMRSKKDTLLNQFRM